MERLINQTIFKCSYCSRISKSAAGILRHELSCKKNKHNQSLCSSCKHCKREEHYSEENVRCNTCPRRATEIDYYGRIVYIDGCELFGEDLCDGRQKYIDFICDIDGCKMYSNKVNRLSSEKAQQIKSRCDRPMPDGTEECANYEYDTSIYGF